MSTESLLESRAAYVGKKLGVSGTRVLKAMIEWSRLTREEKAQFQLPDYAFWTDEEIATLKEYWEGGKSPKEVLEALPGRTYAAITNFASSAEIKRPPEYLSKCRARRS